ncbi:hypothetical protein ACXWO4_09540, partial [Streptococcus pyogenes]
VQVLPLRQDIRRQILHAVVEAGNGDAAIVVEQAASRGIPISLGEFCRAGVPVALACLALGLVWVLVLGP